MVSALPSFTTSSVRGVIYSPASRHPVSAVLSALRVRQWVKNGLVFVAPAAAGTLWQRTTMVHTVAAFFSFSCIASFIYVVNDIRDVADDRNHPTKRFRAIAAGDVSPTRALFIAGALAVIGALIPSWCHVLAGFYVVAALYIVEALSYVLGVKRIPVVETVFVASGFFLRAYAGAAASGIPVSEWFLVVISFGALFLVVGKRSAELRTAGESSRPVLAQYTTDFLHAAVTMTATIVVTAYCLWALDTSVTGLSSIRHGHHVIPIRLSIVPVVVAILFILQAVASPSGETPEDLLLKNHVVQALVSLWAVLVAIGVYA